MGKKPVWVFIVSAVILIVGAFIAFELSGPVAVAQVMTPTTAVTPTDAATPTATLPVAPTPTLLPTNTVPLPSTLSGVVTDPNGVVADATVEIQGSAAKIQTAKDGSFTVSGISGTTPVILTAWAAGHYVGWTTANPSASDWQGGKNLTISMNVLSQTDNSNYDWYSFDGVKGSQSCGMCHREYSEWQSDAHAHAATNPHFVDMYTGTDMKGDTAQYTQLDSSGNPLPPDPKQPYYGPGYRMDNPSRAGDCATCHTPMASKSSNQQNCAWSGCHTSLTIEQSNGVIARPAIPLNLHNEAAEGISCEFCHKIGNVVIDPKTNLPYPDMPGILSLQLYRPTDDSHQVFFGTLVDVTRPDSYLPLLSQSQFCAGCHYGVMGGVLGMGDVKGGTLVYDSYGEWLASPYSDPKTGQTCQDCHMAVSGSKFTVFPDAGGLSRDYAPMHDHTMLGPSDKTFMQNAVSMKGTAQRSGDKIQVQVSIDNDNTGHDLPTDAPMRSVILVVQATDADGKTVTLSQGPVNPAYSGDYGGQPGKTFAKILKDTATGEMPTSAFWRPTTIAEDTRLVAMATDTTNYTFNAPAGKAVTISVRLIYRRAFAELEQQKGWNDPDILMNQDTLQVPAN